MLLAVDLPPFEYIIVALAVLIGLIGRIVEFAKQMRQKSIEAEQQAEAQFGAELEEAPEPGQAPPPRLELARRPPRPHREEPLPVVAPPPPRPPPARAATVKARPEHEILRLLRTRTGAKQAVILAEILGRPKALRRGR